MNKVSLRALNFSSYWNWPVTQLGQKRKLCPQKKSIRETVRAAPPQKKKGGWLSALAAMVIGSALTDRIKRKRAGRCHGDCANCPPHYGYRHGRWYYGKGHQYGCEFGGNKGDGGF